MIIHKVINNNIVSSIDENNQELILMGKGLAFGKSKGDEIDYENVEKTFYLKDEKENDRFQDLLKSIPVEIIRVSDEVIEYAKSKLNRELNDGIYITLMDHINFAIERYLKGIYTKNALMWEIQQFYKEQFEVANEMLKIINNRLVINLSDDEAGFIALHLVNAELNTEIPEAELITKFIQEVLNIVRYYFKIELDVDSLNYHRFVTHLKFFARRLLDDSKNVNDDEILYNILKERYSKADKCVDSIEQCVQRNFNKSLTLSERIYLIMHISRITI